MHTDVNEMPEIIDLCTPNSDSVEPMDTPIIVQTKPIASTITVERISTLDQRLSILPLYPTNDLEDPMKYPLLANLPRKSRKE